jgi:urease accessory protein
MPPDAQLPDARWRARLALEFERRGERSVLASRTHDGPLVVQKPLHPEDPEVCHAIVVHPPAGIVGGDELEISATAREGAHAVITTPGAAKWYRSAGAWATSRVTLAIEEGAVAEWIPQETIVFDGARADIAWEAHLTGSARLFAWDIVRLGRTASGERFTSGEIRSSTRILRDGRPEWIERARIAPGSAAAHSPAALGGAPVFGTMVCAAPGLEAVDLAALRHAAASQGEGALTRLPGLIIARYRGASTEAVRGYFASLWSQLRPALAGRAAMAPRIWST